ncbi:calcium-binding protein [Desulfovibrio oxamicus]|uniref:Calcium-binding protein n=1 Tax=Nitratidesulfovibrio oxamicus TaxID=32016 RepID=A0ABS0J7W9_9BACT|nr:EF-hand domain-containing protein [Nitratidesulfovibrio oxamicus]MBG3878494.1 calcium-binding protein [Nitratidesulfovibrio oxamicus]
MKRIIPAALMLLCAATAQADDKFSAMDKDGNASVTWEEFSVAFPQMKKPAFDAIDTDGSGALTHEEWDAFRAHHGQGGMGMGGGMGPKDGQGATMPKDMPKGMGGMGSAPLIQPPSK